MDLSKRAANLHGVREQRGDLVVSDDSPAGVRGADWSAMCELRADAADPEFWNFAGEASVIDTPYTVFDSYGEFTETIKPGAWDATLRQDPLVSMVYMHDMSTVMAQTRSPNLTLSANPNLQVLSRLDKSDWDVQRVAPKVMRGDANSMSFGFRVTDQIWNDDFTDRQITGINLSRGDVSIITTGHGANPAAHGSLRASELDLALRAIRSGTANAQHLAVIRQASRALAAVDETAPSLAAALDAAVDEALDVLQAGDAPTALALLTAADVTADALMAAMGLADPDENDDIVANSGPDPEEVRQFLHRLSEVRERARRDDSLAYA